jgi:hypothetical protein
LTLVSLSCFHINHDEILGIDFSFKQSLLRLNCAEKQLLIARHFVRDKRAHNDWKAFKLHRLEFIKRVFKILQLLLDLNGCLVPYKADDRSGTDLLYRLELSQMKLVLFIVLLPCEPLAAFFIEDDELRKLGLGVKCVIPRIVVSKPQV